MDNYILLNNLLANVFTCYNIYAHRTTTSRKTKSIEPTPTLQGSFFWFGRTFLCLDRNGRPVQVLLLGFNTFVLFDYLLE